MLLASRKIASGETGGEGGHWEVYHIARGDETRREETDRVLNRDGDDEPQRSYDDQFPFPFRGRIVGLGDCRALGPS